MRLVSFNLLNGRSMDGRVDPDRLRAAVLGLDADVLALQEVDRGQDRSDHVDQAAIAAEVMGAAPADWRYVPTVHGTPGARWTPAPIGRDDPPVPYDGPAYGIALVSRLPVTQWHVVALPHAPIRSPVPVGGKRIPVILARDEPRAGLAAVVTTAAGPVTVVTTHLSFVPGWNLVQLRLLVRALAALPGPLVLLGDLNLPGRLPARMTRWPSLVPAVPTFPSPDPKFQIDHVLGRDTLPPVLASRVEQREVSDHRAIVVDFADSYDPAATVA